MTGVGALVQAAAGGDEQAWGALIDRFSRLVWYVARSHGLSVADADDVSQTTWLRLAEHLCRLREPEHVGAWLFQTARNESMRMRRRAQRDLPFDPLAEVRHLPLATDVDVHLLTKERDKALWQAFSKMPSTCRSLLLMLTADPAFSYEEVSESLQIPVGSIGPTRGRCLDRLRNDPQLTSSVRGEETVTLRRNVG